MSALNGQLDVGTGLEILEQFSRNDWRSAPDLVGNFPVPLVNERGDEGPDLPRPGRLDAQEWGLIRENATGEVHLIFGKGGSVVWDPYLDEGTPLAHSHPWRLRERNAMRGVGSVSIDHLVFDPLRTLGRPLTADETLDAGQRQSARNLVAPTVSDFVAPAEQGQSEHTVFTPYVVDAQRNVRNPAAGEENRGRLVWKLTGIKLTPVRQDEDQVNGVLTATIDGRRLWSQGVRARVPARTPPPGKDENDWKDRRDKILKSTNYTRVPTPLVPIPLDRELPLGHALI